MPLYLVLPIAAALVWLALKNFRLAVGFFIVVLPSYLLRFSVGPLPSTILELFFWIIFGVWMWRWGRFNHWELKGFFLKRKWLMISLLLFFIASIASIFISAMQVASLGQWRAYFLEPLMLFVMLVDRRKILSTDDLTFFLGLSTFSVSAWAIVQKVTGLGFPDAVVDHSRVTSFFTSPNAVGLYLGPIMILLLAKIIFLKKNNQLIPQNLRHLTLWFYPVLLILAALAIVFTKSLGTVAALLGAVLLLALLINWKKAAVLILILAAVGGVLFSPLQQFVLSKDRSSGNRVQLWTYSEEFLTASPKNFIFGTGLRQFFRKIQKPHYDPKKMERLIYPHDIFLNFWTELGLFGMLGFVGIFSYLAWLSFRVYRSKDRWLGATLLAALAVVLLHGLVDVPYFKNDLAMLFWIFAALIINLSLA